MIKDYEIITHNGEELLCLFVNIDEEFAKVGKGKKKLKKNIEEYIAKNKIIFHGAKVALIASGALIGTILLNQPDVTKTYEINPPVVAVLDTRVPEVSKEEKIIEIKEEIPIVKEEVKKEEKKETSQKKETSPAKKTTTASKNTSAPVSKSEEKVSSVTKNDNVKEEKIEDTKIYVTINRKNGTIINVELEEYVLGVVAAEMPAFFSLEALKAQAVIARTYALKVINRGTKLTDTSSIQNYKDDVELKKMWGSSYTTYYQKIKKAVGATEGVYLTYQGEIIDAVYHSTSNGRTENAENVWKNSFPYLVSVESFFDQTNPSFQSEIFFTFDELINKMGFVITSETDFVILSKTIGNRVEAIKIGDLVFTGVEIRSKLGLRSADFEIEKEDTGVRIITKGFGHGVGLSQYGANGMAKNGASFKEILLHYYKGVSLDIMK